MGGVWIGAVDAVVDGLADEVDAKCDQGGAEARQGVAHLVADHRVLPPFVPPPEKLPRRSQRLGHRSASLLLPLSSLDLHPKSPLNALARVAIGPVINKLAQISNPIQPALPS